MCIVSSIRFVDDCMALIQLCGQPDVPVIFLRMSTPTHLLPIPIGRVRLRLHRPASSSGAAHCFYFCCSDFYSSSQEIQKYFKGVALKYSTS